MRARFWAGLVWSVCLTCLSPASAKLPVYFSEVLAASVALQDGSTPDAQGAYVLGSRAALALEQQLKRVIGADESLDLNVSQVRALPDFDLYRLLMLAAVGNFTTSKASAWQQPVAITVAPDTGLFVASGRGGASDAALRVLLVVMCAVMFKRWMEDEARAQAAARAAGGDRPAPAAADTKQGGAKSE